MATTVIKQRLLVRYGGKFQGFHTMREYDFCLANFVDANGNILASGMAPSGRMERPSDPNGVIAVEADWIMEIQPMPQPEFISDGNIVERMATGFYV